MQTRLVVVLVLRQVTVHETTPCGGNHQAPGSHANSSDCAMWKNVCEFVVPTSAMLPSAPHSLVTSVRSAIGVHAIVKPQSVRVTVMTVRSG